MCVDVNEMGDTTELTRSISAEFYIPRELVKHSKNKMVASNRDSESAFQNCPVLINVLFVGLWTSSCASSRNSAHGCAPGHQVSCRMGIGNAPGNSEDL